MTRQCLSALLLAFLTSVACADELTLTPTTSSSGPYGHAILTIPRDQISADVRALRIRDAHGGPSWIVPLIPAAHGPTTCPLSLPPIRVYQNYTIEMLPGSDSQASPLRTTQVAIAWPASQVDRDAFVNANFCSDFDARQSHWPAELRWTLLFSTVMVAMICMAVRLAPWVCRRPMVLLVVPLLATGLAIVYLRARPAILERHTPDGTVTVLTTRRSATWTHDRSLRPVFRDLGAWMEDETVIFPDRIEVPIAPGHVKLFTADAPAKD